MTSIAELVVMALKFSTATVRVWYVLLAFIAVSAELSLLHDEAIIVMHDVLPNSNMVVSASVMVNFFMER